LAKDPAFREALTPQIALQAFEKHFGHVNGERAPASLLKGLGTRPDVDLGDMRFLQQNLFSWETMVSSAAYQLSQREETPAAMVFEPPGRVGTSRTLPEMNMTYGCQIPPHNPGHLIDILVGFLRGGARLSDKSWGISIYGQVHRADAFGFLTHAYDLGATHFFFWTNHRLACVPHGECLALARNLRAHVENRPLRDLERRRQAAEVAILLPPGYNLGHVAMGKGSLWGLGELNLERTNREGVKYRVVMRNFFMEIERCLRLGVAFDLLWDLPGIDPSGYREVVRVREDGDVEIDQGRKHVVLRGARTPPRPSGMPPGLVLRLSGEEGTVPFEVTGTAQVTEKSAPVYYTLGANPHGVSHNAMVAWELYGPDEEDYRFFRPPALTPHVVRRGAVAEVKARFAIGRPGTYRLRVATVDMAGRTTVVWKRIVATE
jgi:hypothetical protein